MTSKTNIEMKTENTAYLNGKKVNIVSIQSDYILIEDEQGNRQSVKKEALKNTPLFNFYSQEEQDVHFQEAKKKRTEQIAYFQEKAEEAGKLKNEWIDKIKDLLAQLFNLDKNDELYKGLNDEYWAARFSKTAASNKEHHYYIDACMIASDPIGWG